MKLDLSDNWYILQDVHDKGERLGLPERDDFLVLQGPQMSEWEELPELKHLQLIYAENPYWGRELRYFNQAPWWYKREFTIDMQPETAYDQAHYVLHFTNVDYYCRVWLNGIFLGEHEGYSSPFELNLDGAVKNGENRLIVKVWSPWDDEVEDDLQERRTFRVYRNMIKGTYEHSDTFVQRDVNPVGIYGKVTLECWKRARFSGEPDITYELNEEMTEAAISISVHADGVGEEVLTLVWNCRDRFTGKIVCEGSEKFSGNCLQAKGIVPEIRLWNTWDQGTPYTYQFQMRLLSGNVEVDRYETVTGFRKIEMVRNEKQTMFQLNGKNFYMRGTAYFPDNYISQMTRERYERDLQLMKLCGFNMIRVHVHVDLPEFYELCTEMGFGIMHDSEYNWSHPLTEEFCGRFITIYLQTVDMLKKYPALLCWICMNEPGNLDDSEDKSQCRAMTVNPGPRLYEAVCRHDPSRPVIKGSYCENDLCSGDSHNYIGSLCGPEGHYSDIYGTTEKMNTEFGFDAPPCLQSLKKIPKVYQRLAALEKDIESIGKYQYALLKYYTEHYRMQKYTPNSGYVQFLFNDMCPQSFYGIYDYWGIPKEGVKAMQESNQPVGIFMKYREKLDEIYVVNDHPYELGTCRAGYTITDAQGRVIKEECRDVEIGADSLAQVFRLDDIPEDGEIADVFLWLEKNGDRLASNIYRDVFYMPEHTAGHPVRMSHETGCRIYYV